MFKILSTCSEMFLDSGLKLLNYLCVILLKSSTRSNSKIYLAILMWATDNVVKACLFFVLWVHMPADSLSLGSTGQPQERRLLSLAKSAEEKRLISESYKKVGPGRTCSFLFFSFRHPHVSPVLSQLCIPQRSEHLGLIRKVVWPTKNFFLSSL